MKFSLLTTFLVPTLVSAVAVEPRKVNYDGYQVVRVKTSEKVNKIINANKLPTWSGRPENVEYADVVLTPGSKVFSGIKTEVMHEDLGKSIAEESQFAPLAGKQGSRFIFRLPTHGPQLKPPTSTGLTATTPTPTT
jgi:hypothetical protein